MKKILLSVLMTAFCSIAFAQAPLSKGQAQFNGGFGFSSWGLPIYLGLDYGVHPDVTIGGEASFRTYNETFLGTNYGSTIIGISANGNYHFNTLLEIPSNIDFYAGLNLGFYIWNTNGAYPGKGASGLGLGAQIGGRYYFTDKIGVNLELGGGSALSGGKIGISIKL